MRKRRKTKYESETIRLPKDPELFNRRAENREDAREIKRQEKMNTGVQDNDKYVAKVFCE
jgi:hypothetical protein